MIPFEENACHIKTYRALDTLAFVRSRLFGELGPTLFTINRRNDGRPPIHNPKIRPKRIALYPVSGLRHEQNCFATLYALIGCIVCLPRA